MVVETTTVTDKLNREVIIRSAVEEDAEDLIRYLKVTSAETPYLIREADEINISISQEKEFIQSRSESGREAMLVAVVDGKLAGVCSVMSLSDYRRYRHRCEVAIALYRDYCGCGIGKSLLTAILDMAKRVGYEQAELEVSAENDTAIGLYDKMGFQRYGTFPDNIKYSDGRYADSYWMMKKL